MELIQQVCSLESAKRLKELGVKQESLFYWSDDILFFSRDLVIDEEYYGTHKNVYSAFTVAELLNEIPFCRIGLSKSIKNVNWYIWNDSADAKDDEKSQFSENLPDAIAKMIIEHRPTQNQARGR